MTTGLSAFYSAPAPAAPPPAGTQPQRAEQGPAFGDLLAPTGKPPPHAARQEAEPAPAPARGDAAETGAAPREVLPAANRPEAEEEAGPEAAGNSDKEPEREEPPAWAAIPQMVALMPKPNRLPKSGHPGPAGEVPRAAPHPTGGEGKAATQEAAATGGNGPQRLQPMLQAAAIVLQHRLGEAAGSGPPSPASVAGRVTTKRDAERAAPHENRSSLQAAAVSLGLFGSEAPAAETGRPDGKARGDATAPQRHGLPADEKPSLVREAGGASPERSGTAGLLNQLTPVGVLPQAVQPKAFGAFLAGSVATHAAPTSAMPETDKSLPANQLRTLEIQLHPAELGGVTAKLRIREQGISVEIAADSPGGRDSLSAQEGTIRASLEALGLRVERLTIQHVAAPGTADRNGSDQGAGNRGEGAQNGGGSQSGGAEGQGRASGDGTGRNNSERNGRGADGGDLERGSGARQGSAGEAARSVSARRARGLVI